MNATNTPHFDLDAPTMPDLFIRALITDARSLEPALRWERVHGKTQDDPDEYVINGFAGSNAKIVLTKDFITDNSDCYTLVYYCRGERNMAAQERSILSEYSELRELYELASHEEDSPSEKIDNPDGITEFGSDKDARLFLDRVLGPDFPTTTPLLVSDIFRACNAMEVVDRYMAKFKKRHCNTQGKEYDDKRTRTLAMATITALRNMKRVPTGATFARKEIRQQQDLCRTVGCEASLYQIANAWTTWHDIYPQSTICRKEMMNRTAVLLLAAILKEN
jgi:hypothetical protein